MVVSLPKAVSLPLVATLPTEARPTSGYTTIMPHGQDCFLADMVLAPHFYPKSSTCTS